MHPDGRVATWALVRDHQRLVLSGELRLEDATAIWSALRATATNAAPRLDIDLARPTLVDGAVMALLVELRASLLRRGIESEIIGVREPLCSVVHMYRGDERSVPVVAGPPSREDPISRFGAALARLGARLRDLLTFAGELLGSMIGARRRPKDVNWRAIPTLIVRAGADGLLIVLLLNFLIGFVMAYQSMRQLKSYGANLFVADIVGLAVTRELAPLITAVIITGRSGAAFAAELGTMRVSDEIDALSTMGFAPLPYLVVPRVIALAVIAPALTLLGDVVGVLGGMVVGLTTLGISSNAFLAELRSSLVPADVWTGLVKSLAFGIAIAFIGCRQGLATRGSASEVGRGTTATVVYCLFSIIVIDSVLTVLFREYGL